MEVGGASWVPDNKKEDPRFFPKRKLGSRRKENDSGKEGFRLPEEEEGFHCRGSPSLKNKKSRGGEKKEVAS